MPRMFRSVFCGVFCGGDCSDSQGIILATFGRFERVCVLRDVAKSRFVRDKELKKRESA